MKDNYNEDGKRKAEKPFDNVQIFMLQVPGTAATTRTTSNKNQTNNGWRTTTKHTRTRGKN